MISGLVQINQPEIQKALLEEVQGLGGRGACNLRLTHQVSVVDWLLGQFLSTKTLAAVTRNSAILAIPFELYQPTTVVVEGFVY